MANTLLYTLGYNAPDTISITRTKVLCYRSRVESLVASVPA
jgi:hypothetical protein